MYHSISEDSEKGISPYYRVTTSPGRFIEQMQWLSCLGYSAITLTEALQKLKTNRLINDRCVVLTFDDGFHDFLVNAWPILKDLGFSATVYLATNYVGESRKTFKGRTCLTWQDVRELHSQGVSFGSHTINHPTLYGLPWGEIRRELKESRQKIEKELASPIPLFCYPYAFPQEDEKFIRRLRQELILQGYSYAMTTVIGRVHSASDPLCLPRLPVNNHDDQKFFEAKLAGAYDWLTGVQAAARRLKPAIGNRRL